MELSSREWSQLNTPEEWILDNKLFRIKCWEISLDIVKETIKNVINNDNFKLSMIMDKNKNSKGVCLLYVNDSKDVEKIRTSILKTRCGTELRKINKSKFNDINTRTIKTTAPIWVTENKIYDIFKEFNTDSNKYDIIVNKKEKKNVMYPIIRLYPTTVYRNNIKTKVNVIYIEYSPLSKCKYDGFMALSIYHRLPLTNSIDNEKINLIFDKWTVEKPKSRSIKEKSKDMIKEKEN